MKPDRERDCDTDNDHEHHGKEKPHAMAERQRCLTIIQQWIDQGTPVMQYTAQMIASAIRAGRRF